jgi:hypothetical protein
MARKPVDAYQGGLTPRERIWAALRRLRFGTRREIAIAAKARDDTTRDYLRALVAGGLVEESHNDAGVAGYRLVRDAGLEVPRLRADGTPVTQGLAREQMWRTMRLLGTFTLDDLVVQASTDEVQIAAEDAKSYAYWLAKAGYLRVIEACRCWRFIPTRYSGPKPPMVQRVKAVFDPNLQRVVWPDAGSGAGSGAVREARS